MNGDKARDGLTQRILDLTLEMIFLLTGEDHVVVKIHEMDNSSHQIPGGYRRTPSFNMELPPHSEIHERNSEKILELTHRILRLLTGEVPIRCEDVTVHLSMEEWEYMERHKDFYEDVMMEDHQPVITAGKSVSWEFHAPPSLPDLGTKTGSQNINNNVEKCLYKTTKGRAPSVPYTEQERHVPEGDIYPSTEYPPPYIKEEPGSCEEDNLTVTYKPPEPTQTECAPGNFGEYLKGNTNPMGINPNESLIKFRNPGQSIYYTDPVTNNFIYKGNIALSPEMEKVSCSESDLVINETICKEEPPFSSTDCLGNFTPASALKHQHVHTEEQPFSCPECGEHFTDSIALKKHQKIHKEKKLFKCSECGKCYTRNSNLAAHKRTHTGEKPYICPECGKCFTDSAALKRHHRSHTGERPYKCPECGKCFIDRAALKWHHRIHTGIKPYKCLECGKCFIRASSLAKHKRIHTGEKPFKCTECGKCFRKSSLLALHERIHTGVKPFKCPECGKCFTQVSYLAAHERIHRRIKPYKCPECGKCFRNSSLLAAHERTHTGEKPFKCPEFGKCLAQSSTLTKHKRIHTVKKPFTSSECGNCFHQASSLGTCKRLHEENP